MTGVDAASPSRVSLATGVSPPTRNPHSTPAAGEPKPIVLFDFDGVLSRGAAFYLFMRDRYTRSLWRVPLALVALPWLFARTLVSRRWPLRSLVHIALLGLNEARYRVAAERFADHLARKPRQFYADGLKALRRHQAAGERVVVVTGCEEILVTRLLAQLGLRQVEVVASQLRPGWFGMRVQRHNVGVRKVQRLAAHGIDACALAYSDSHRDVPMLRLAGEAVMVNGTPTVCKRVERGLGRACTRVQWY